MNCNALIEKWDNIKAQIACMLPVKERNECMNYYDQEIGFFISLLRLVSIKTKFADRVNQLILFTDVSDHFRNFWIEFMCFVLNVSIFNCKVANEDPFDTVAKMAGHPCLIAYGPTKKDLKQFSISLEGHIIKVFNLLLDFSLVLRIIYIIVKYLILLIQTMHFSVASYEGLSQI